VRVASGKEKLQIKGNALMSGVGDFGEDPGYYHCFYEYLIPAKLRALALARSRW